MLDRFRNTSPRAQTGIIIGGVAVVTLVILLLWFFVLRVAYTPVFTRMRPIDAAAVVTELEHQKIPYRLSDGGTTISVPEDRADATRLSLVRSDLSLKDAVGFELFNKSDMGITEFAQKINYQRALQGELERTISALDGVETARVHLSMGNDRLFREDRVNPKASVTLRMVNNAMVPPGTVDGVQQLVSAAVPQLDPSAVVILDEGGQVLSATSMQRGAPDTSTPHMAEKHALEQYYEARVRDALDRNFTPESIKVAVWIDLSQFDQSGAAPTQPNTPVDPQSRTFPMQVTLSPTGGMTPETQASARSVTAEAIGYKAMLGDAIVFGPVQATLVSRPAEPVVRVANSSALDGPTEPVDDHKGGNTVLLILAAGVVVAASIIFIVLYARRRPLDEQSKMAFAERLRAMIDEEEGR